MPQSTIVKRRRPAPGAGTINLLHRRVAVPQQYVGFDDEDDFSFKGSIISTECAQRVLIRFDYTMEEEWFPVKLARRWLEPDEALLCDALSAALAVC
jgi:hypothetical protein